MAGWRFSLTGILLIAALVRFFRLGVGSLWYDEGYSTFLASESVPELIAHTARDIHPPLYYLLLHGWMRVAGQSDLAVALPSVFFGVVLVALSARVAFHWFGLATGVATAVIMAVATYQVWYSQEVRMYSLAAVLGLLVTAAAGSGGRRAWLGYALASALSLYTLHYAAFLLVAVNLFLVWRLVRRSEIGWTWRRWLAAQLTILLLYLPWLPVTLRQVLSPAVPPWREFTSIGSAIGQAWSGIVLGQALDPVPWLAVLVLAAGLLLIGVRATWSHRTALALAASLGPITLIWIVSIVTPLFHVRYLVPFSPLLYIVIGAGIAALWQNSKLVGMLALSALLLGFSAGLRGYYLDDLYAPDDYESAVGFLSERWRPGDAILLNAGYIYAPVLHYWQLPIGWRGRLNSVADFAVGPPAFYQTGTIDGPTTLGGGDPESDFYPTTWPKTEAALQVLAGRHHRLWVVRGYDTVTDPDGRIRAWLLTNGRAFEDRLFSGSSAIRVQGFLLGEATPTGPPISTTGPIDVAGQPTFAQAETGSTASIELAWLPRQALDRTLRAYLALVADDGRIWVQQDEPAIGTSWTPGAWQPGRWTADPRAIRIPPGTPAGRYRVELGAYLVGGAVLEFREQDGRRTPRATLGTIEVLGRAALPDPAYDLPVGLELADGVRLAGAQFRQFDVEAGNPLQVDLYWRAGDRRNDIVPVVRVVDSNGQEVGEQRGVPADGRAPSSGWLTNELIRDPRNLVISPRASGPARLEVAVGERSVRLTDLQIFSRPRRFDIPVGGRPVGIRFGEVAELISAEIAAAAERSASLSVVWRSLGETTTSYVVFVQLLDSLNRVAGQRDVPPGGGGALTTSWVKDEVVLDRFELSAGPGRYRLIIGMYDPRNGSRLRTAVGADFVELGEVEIR